MEPLKQSEKRYFASWFQLQHRDLYLIWIKDELESVFVDEQGFIPVFDSEMTLAAYAKIKGFAIVNEEPKLHNMDAVAEWLQQPQSPIDCMLILGAWNMFTDVAHALHLTFIGDKMGGLRNRIYDKLYFGINDPISKLMPDRPSEDFYIPQWSLKEREKIAQVLTQGLVIFKSKLRETKV